MRSSIVSCALALLLVATGNTTARAAELDLVLVVDSTGSMVSYVHLLDDILHHLNGDLVGAGHSPEYALVSYEAGNCTLQLDRSSFATFASAYDGLSWTGVGGENLSRALRDCVPLVSFRPQRPRYLIWATDKDDQGSVAERAEAVSMLLGGVGASSWALTVPNSSLTFPAIDALLTATCSVDPADEAPRRFELASSSAADELASSFLDTYSPWLCSGIFTDGFDSGNVSAWSSGSSILLAQNWSHTGLITTDDDWTGVPGIVGHRGDELTVTGGDPQEIVADGTATPIDVNANRGDPDSFTAGGITEFDGLPDPTVALNGSGTADAPFLLLSVDASDFSDLTVSYNLRDLDGSADNAVSQVAVQYRVGDSGEFTNLPAGYVADASRGPDLAGWTTWVSASLPGDANHAPLVQVRIITANAAGADEWIGIDDLLIAGTRDAP